MVSFTRRLWEISCLIAFSGVIGAGFGFLQGFAAFGGYPVDDQLQLSSWAALTGLGASIVFGPILYFWLIRGRLGLEILGQIILISLVAGVGSAVVLRMIGDGGWVSCLITPFVALLATIKFRFHPRS